MLRVAIVAFFKRVQGQGNASTETVHRLSGVTGHCRQRRTFTAPDSLRSGVITACFLQYCGFVSGVIVLSSLSGELRVRRHEQWHRIDDQQSRY